MVFRGGESTFDTITDVFFVEINLDVMQGHIFYHEECAEAIVIMYYNKQVFNRIDVIDGVHIANGTVFCLVGTLGLIQGRVRISKNRVW